MMNKLNSMEKKSHLKIVVLIFIISTFLINCNEKKESNNSNNNEKDQQVGAKNPSVEGNDPVKNKSVNSLYGLKYDKTKILSILNNQDYNNPHSKLILKLFSRDVFDSEIKFQLQAYAAKNHAHYGKETVPDILDILDTCHITNTSDFIVFGNSEVQIEKIRRVIMNGTDVLDFDFLVFYPKIDPTTNCLLYRIYAVKGNTHVYWTNKNKIDWEIDLTNPSPPKGAIP